MICPSAFLVVVETVDFRPFLSLYAILRVQNIGCYYIS